jgi:hypothetical protein
MNPTPQQSDVYGVLAEFEHPEDLIVATQHAYDTGYRMMEAYTPFPVDGVADALGYRHDRLPFVVLAGGIIGGLSGFLMQWYTATIDYPVNIGGRPFNSWPAFMPITFEMTILVAAFSAVFGMLAFNGLPRPHHPVFNEPRFVLASRNRFFLCLQARDPLFKVEDAKRLLEEHHPRTISVLPA